MYRPSPSGFLGTSDTGKLYTLFSSCGGATCACVCGASAPAVWLSTVDMARAARRARACGGGEARRGRWRESNSSRAPALAPAMSPGRVSGTESRRLSGCQSAGGCGLVKTDDAARRGSAKSGGVMRVDLRSSECNGDSGDPSQRDSHQRKGPNITRLVMFYNIKAAARARGIKESKLGQSACVHVTS